MMKKKLKKLLAVLLSMVTVVSSLSLPAAAAPPAQTGKYERPEPGREDAAKTAGTWTKDADGG